MEFEFKIKVGETEISVKESAKNHTDFFEKLSFFSNLPKTGPNGETDLVLQHKNVDGYDFYSIICKSANKELKFGQSKKEAGKLFPKGWEPIYRGKGNYEEMQKQEPSKKVETKATPSIKMDIPTNFNLPKTEQVTSPLTQEHKDKAQAIAEKYGFLRK